MSQSKDFDPANLSGVHAAPNIQTNPDLYEIENRAADPDRLIEKAIREVASWEGKIVLDLGAGTGFHLGYFHKEASHVIAIEPHAPSRLKAMARAVRQEMEKVSVMAGSAEQILLPEYSVDLVHARFAYFWGPGCEPGLRELERVIRPGGWAFIIDNYLAEGTFAAWLKRNPLLNNLNSRELEDFWSKQGFASKQIASEWRFLNRADLEAVIKLEFPAGLAAQIIEEHPGTRVEYHYALYYRQY